MTSYLYEKRQKTKIDSLNAEACHEAQAENEFNVNGTQYSYSSNLRRKSVENRGVKRKREVEIADSGSETRLSKYTVNSPCPHSYKMHLDDHGLYLQQTATAGWLPVSTCSIVIW